MTIPSHPTAALPGARRHQAGFTLVELMISVALGLLIMIALIAVYLNISRTNSEMAKTNSVIENGRFSIDVLEEDISHAGFWGGYVPIFDDVSDNSATAPGDAPSDLLPAGPPDPCLAYASWAGTAGYVGALLGVPVQSFDTTPTNCTATVTNKQASTDVLVVRHVDNCLVGAGNCEADTFANAVPKVYFQASRCSAELLNAPPYRYVLSNTPANFTLRNRGCTGTPPGTTGSTPADRRKYVSSMYYVRTYAVTPGDGIPTLVRSTYGLAPAGTTPGWPTPAALIEGVQGFAVELGIDAKSRCGTAVNTLAMDKVDPTTSPCAVNAATPASNTLPRNRGDGVPESFVRCSGATGCTNAQLQNAVAVKVYVLARSRDITPGFTDNKVYCLGSSCTTPTATSCPAVGTNAYPLMGPFCDGYKRHVFQTTVRLVNVAGRRETP